MKKLYTLFILILFSVSVLHTQYLNVRISDVVYGEEWVSINPKNPNQIVAGVIGDYGQVNSIMGYYYSTNSGLNWNGGPITTTLGQCGSDPVVLVDTAGNFYYICCANWMVPGPNLDKFFCFKSTNGGMNWDNGTIFAHLYPQMDDMPMGCVDFSNSIYRNNIYVTWTLYDSMGSHNPLDSSYVYFTSSTDEGNTFTIPKRVSPLAGHGYYDNTCPEGPVPAVGINGEVYVCFTTSEKIYFNRSTDGGNSWLSNDIFVSNQPGGWWYHHSPVITCDLSNSPYKGSIYICFSDLRNGANDRDIWFTKSTNNGNNWSNSIRVNDDAAGHLQEMPWICVDMVTGYIWIAFYDSRNYPNNIYTNLYVARSTDGGNTFLNSKVSNSYTNSSQWNGDYLGISAYNNKVRPVWARYINGYHNELWTAIIDTFPIGIKPISNEVPNSFSLYQNYPNPFNPSTKIKYQIPRESFVKLIVYDILGKEIAVLVNEKQIAGTYETDWNAGNYPSGVYFYKISAAGGAGEYTETKKMVLIK